MAKDLTIQLDVRGNALSVKSLVDALEKAMVLLRTLDATKEWEVVRVTKQSPVNLVVRNPNAETIAPQYMKSVRKMGRKMDARRPPKILAPTLIATKQLTDVLADGFSGIKICYPGQRAVTFTERMVQNFRNIANVVTESFYEWTTVRGILYQITWNDGVTRCRIRESLNHTEIPCLVTPELLNTVKDALPHRVDLYGRAKSNRLEGIMAIEVERVEILPDLEQSMQSTPAIHITGGMDSREYVERLRGG